MTATDHGGAAKPSGHKQLLLLGAGDAHLHVLASLASHPMPGVQVTLVTPHARHFCTRMLPGFVAGDYLAQACTVALEPRLRNNGVRWLARRVLGLDAQAQTVLLDDGSVVCYDWLSINTGEVQDRTRVEQTMPGAREHGLFVHPVESFVKLWPQVLSLERERLRSVAVIGAGAAAIELTMAIRQRLPQAALTLITGGAVVAAAYPDRARRRIGAALQKRAITVLADRALALRTGEVLLGCGARLACDVPLLAGNTHAPGWLAQSGLALGPTGRVAVDACQRSCSHGNVFAVGGIGERGGELPPLDSGYDAAPGPHLASNLASAVSGEKPRPARPPARALRLLYCGDHTAIALWGSWLAQGHWMWRWKDWLDRRFIDRYG